MEWFKKHSLQIILIITSVAMAWAILNARVSALEEKVNQYPSQDWFELKFQQIDESILENQKKIIHHLENEL